MDVLSAIYDVLLDNDVICDPQDYDGTKPAGFLENRPENKDFSEAVTLITTSGTTTNSKLDIQDYGIQIMIQSKTRQNALLINNKLVNLIGYSYIYPDGSKINNIVQTSTFIPLRQDQDGEYLYSFNILVDYSNYGNSTRFKFMGH